MEVVLSNGRGVALVDDADYDRVSRHRWRRYGGDYAATDIDGEAVYMHHFILGDTSEVDHRDGNGLNNQRENLRPATRTQNMQNRAGWGSSGFKGVSWFAQRGKWRARIAADGREKTIGYFDTAEDAARAYDRKAVELFGEFARLNFSHEYRRAA